MIDASQRMLRMNSQGEGELGGGINPTMKRHLEQETKTLQMRPEMQTRGSGFWK
jgi:hypothetical protein